MNEKNEQLEKILKEEGLDPISPPEKPLNSDDLTLEEKVKCFVDCKFANIKEDLGFDKATKITANLIVKAIEEFGKEFGHFDEEKQEIIINPMIVENYLVIIETGIAVIRSDHLQRHHASIQKELGFLQQNLAAVSQCLVHKNDHQNDK